MSLEAWHKNSWLQPIDPSAADIHSWVEEIDRTLKDTGLAGLSAIGKFRGAYDATLVCAITALAVSGYRPDKRESHHYRALASLEYTLQTSESTRRALDRARTKRSRNLYEGHGDISQKEADELYGMAIALRADLERWIRATYPQLWK